jgi:hypothetical protein
MYGWTDASTGGAMYGSRGGTLVHGHHVPAEGTSTVAKALRQGRLRSVSCLFVMVGSMSIPVGIDMLHPAQGLNYHRFVVVKATESPFVRMCQTPAAEAGPSQAP